MKIKPGDLSDELEWETFKSIIMSRSDLADEFRVDMEMISTIHLAQFNELVKLYVQLRRVNKHLIFENCQHEDLKRLVLKTKFDHLFHLQPSQE